MNSSRFAVLVGLVLVGVSSHAPAQTEWFGGVGDWFEPANWTNAVPDLNNPATVNAGEARFDTPATAGGFQALLIGGQSSTHGVSQTVGTVRGTADLRVTGQVVVGTASGTGQGTVQRGEGRLFLSGADLINDGYDDTSLFPLVLSISRVALGTAGGTGTGTRFTGVGTAELVDGSIRTEGSISVGHASGTGTGGERHADGDLRITRGDLIGTGSVSIGSASGTGSTDGFANGKVEILSGDLVVLPRTDPFTVEPFSSLSVGTAGGTGQFDGSAVGELIVERGDVIADNVLVGSAGGISRSTSRAEGRITVRGGDIRMRSMAVGTLGGNGISANGLAQISGGSILGESLSIGAFGELVLDLGAPVTQPTATSVTIDEVDFGKVRVDDVQIDGGLTARFLDGFQPEPGQQFDLIVTDQLAGDFSLEVVGLDPVWLDQLTVVQTPTLLRLQFAVPEPTAAVLLAINLLCVAARR